MDENYYNNPKEIFKYLGEISKENIKDKCDVLDVGCARGEFLFFLNEKYGVSSAVGIDYSELLIDNAQKFEGLTWAHFQKDNAENFCFDREFDLIYLTGVLSFFDDPTLVLANIKKHLKQNGRAFITGIFNYEYNVDVLLKYRNYEYNSSLRVVGIFTV